MPYAEHAETALRWATERAITCWAWFADDLSAEDLASLAAAVDGTRADGAAWALVVPTGQEARADERLLANVSVTGNAPPAPWGLFAAMQAVGLPDVRQLGVIASNRVALEAGARAGA